jgi:hypothetical protein
VSREQADKKIDALPRPQGPLKLGPNSDEEFLHVFVRGMEISDYLSAPGASKGMIGCARNRKSKEGGKSPDHGIGATLIG